jgi:hypothetical protein
MINARPFCRLIFFGFALGIIACGTASPPVSFYSLNALAVETSSAPAAPVLAIGVGPVVLPGYLDRPQLIVRSGPNHLRIDEYHRWAGRLNQEIVRVLSENLMILLKSSRVAPIPWASDFNPDIAVRVEVFAFEAAADGAVRLRANLILTDRRPSGLPEQAWTVDLTQQSPEAGYDAIVATQSRLLADVSRQIAEAIARR